MLLSVLSLNAINLKRLNCAEILIFKKRADEGFRCKGI